MATTELEVKLAVDLDSERQVFAYGGKGLGMFALVIFRCPSCGSTGTAYSWCEGHSAPMECVGSALRVKREPVLVPHADNGAPTTELYDREDPHA